MTLTNNVFAIIGAKGGVGKTTTTLNLSAALAREGYSTIAVELDIGMANFVDFLDVGINIAETETLYDVLAGRADIESACYEVTDGFSVAVSGTNLTDYANTSLSNLPDIIEKLRWQYDIVLLDTPAGLNEESVSSLQVADQAILVSTPRVASVRNAKNTLELADRVNTDIYGLILTKSGTGASPGAGRIAEFLDSDLLGHVPEDDAVAHSQDRGKPVVIYAPQSGAATAYRKIVKRLVGEKTESNQAMREPAPDPNNSTNVERPRTEVSAPSPQSNVSDDVAGEDDISDQQNSTDKGAVSQHQHNKLLDHSDDINRHSGSSNSTARREGTHTPGDHLQESGEESAATSMANPTELQTHADESSQNSTTAAQASSKTRNGHSPSESESANEDAKDTDSNAGESTRPAQIQPNNDEAAAGGKETVVEATDGGSDTETETTNTSVSSRIRTFLGF